MYLFFSFWIHYIFVHRSCGHLVIANIVLIFDIYIYDVVIIFISPISPCVVFLLVIW